jgi:hypothetical protein
MSSVVSFGEGLANALIWITREPMAVPSGAKSAQVDA